MKENHAIQLGMREVWGGEIPFGLGVADRRQHVYVIGKSGTGKTALLRNSIIQDISAGRGVGVIDPHGDLAESLLNHIPPHRTDDLIYFDATAADFPIGLNLLQNVSPDERHRVASELVTSLKAIHLAPDPDSR